MKVVFKYIPEHADKPMSSLPGLIDEVFKKAGYEEKLNAQQVEEMLKKEFEKMRLERDAKVTPPIQPPSNSNKLTKEEAKVFIDVDEDEEPTPPQEPTNQDNTPIGFNPLAALLGAILGATANLETDADDNSLTNNEIAVLKSCQSEDDWTNAVQAIKDARNGYYPEDWFEKIVNSGLQKQIQSRWRK